MDLSSLNASSTPSIAGYNESIWIYYVEIETKAEYLRVGRKIPFGYREVSISLLAKEHLGLEQSGSVFYAQTTEKLKILSLKMVILFATGTLFGNLASNISNVLVPQQALI